MAESGLRNINQPVASGADSQRNFWLKIWKISHFLAGTKI